MNTPTVSIVIVCMNNLKNLYPCLDSIKKYTTVRYETLVVAYLFSDENLEKLKQDYPWIIITESKEIRGFSENNNLALRQAKGEYCLVLNDDTFFDTPVIDILLNSIDNHKDPLVKIISPILRFPNGNVQYNGREKRNAIDFFLAKLKLDFLFKRSKHSGKQGIYQTYNISGACFLIDTKLFKEVGFFDETYFFCPEDIALSTRINQMGYKVFVNSNISITHIHQSSSAHLNAAIMPVTDLGGVMFYSSKSYILEYFLRIFIFLQSLLKYVYIIIVSNNKDTMRIQTYKNTFMTILGNHTPKELFIKLYNKIDKK